MMELLILLVLLCGLGALAIQFGRDSWDGAPSEEQVLAGYGLIWDEGLARRPASDAATERSLSVA
jgi:hypothetical protein